MKTPLDALLVIVAVLLLVWQSVTWRRLDRQRAAEGRKSPGRPSPWTWVVLLVCVALFVGVQFLK